MNDEHYIAALKRALSGLDRKTRDEILREIRSHMQDTHGVETLEQRFGPVEELASQYLDGEPLPPSVGARLGKFSKTALLFIGGIFITCILIIVVLAAIYSRDKFDYADKTALAQAIKPGEWSVREWLQPIDLTVDQAHVVLYWHDEPEIRWHCKGRDEIDPVPGQQLKIRHGYCLILLPRQEAHLDIIQSDVVLVRPDAPVTVQILQSELRIAELGKPNRYEFDLSHSDAAKFQSDANAGILISISAIESSIKHYDN
ncbi:MAG: hypothetical protein GY935_01015 [Gammaproteobacteria bacterium]|nr:hypothetical protein [Gammaproteobacteria bacterium]